MRRPAVIGIVVAAVGVCALAGGAGFAAAATDFTWSGGAVSSENWSAAANWVGNAAPSGAVGTLSFPYLSIPSTESSEGSVDNVAGVSANELSIDDATPYVISEASASDGPLELGAGGVVASTAASTVAPPVIDVPISLSAAQTWSIDGGVQGAGELIFDAPISGSADALAVALANGGYLALTPGPAATTDDNEVGAITIRGADGSDTGVNAYTNGAVELRYGSSLDATDGKTIQLTDAAIFGEGTIAGVNSTGGVITAGDPVGILTVQGGVTLDSTSALQFAIADGGTSAGTDYSHLAVTGNVSLNGAALDIVGTGDSNTCPVPTAGAVDTLLTATGTISGTFAGLPDGAQVLEDCSGDDDDVQINYSAHAVTATMLPVPTTTIIMASSLEISPGQPVTYTAIVTADTTVPETPQGTIDFDGGPASCAAVALTATGPDTATASCTTTIVNSGAPVTADFDRASDALSASSSSPIYVTTATSTADPTLSVAIAGNGSGTVHGFQFNCLVTCNATPITCPGTCSTTLAKGSWISLEPTPAPGSTFVGFEGDACATALCQFSLTTNVQETATFALTVPFTPFTLTAPTPPSSPPPSCTLTPKTARVVAGKVKLTAHCTQAASVTLTGTLVELVGKKPRHGKQKRKNFAFNPLMHTLTAGASVTLTLHLPPKALTALAAHASESATFELSATSTAGSTSASAKIASLKPTG